MATFKIDGGHLIRDASGDFACPNCWYQNFGSLHYPATICPSCGVEVEWTPEATKQAQYYAERDLRKEAKDGNF